MTEHSSRKREVKVVLIPHVILSRRLLRLVEARKTSIAIISDGCFHFPAMCNSMNPQWLIFRNLFFSELVFVLGAIYYISIDMYVCLDLFV